MEAGPYLQHYFAPVSGCGRHREPGEGQRPVELVWPCSPNNHPFLRYWEVILYQDQPKHRDLDSTKSTVADANEEVCMTHK